MQRMYRICICGCQAIYIQVRPLRKEKFNGRIHGLLPALLPGYMCCSLMILLVLNSVQSRQVQRHTHWTYFHIELFLFCVACNNAAQSSNTSSASFLKVVNLISLMTNNMDRKNQPRVECFYANILKGACSWNNLFIYSIEIFNIFK